MKNLIFVTYDGIQNSVFSSQVIQPLLKKINNNPELKVYIVSFEKNYLSQDIITKYIPQNKNLIFMNYRRLPVLGKISLYPSVYYLKKFLKQFESYEIISRGPLAGWVAMKAINVSAHTERVKRVERIHILQARGLLAEEYAFSHLPQLNIFKRFWHTWRKNSLFKIEKEAYTSSNIIIKPVSYALSDYLIQTYKIDPKKLVLENDDIPNLIPEEQKNEWRQNIRKKLNISANTQIYCYNGAAKAWQCPDLVINYFLEQLNIEENNFLLILTQDKEEFERMLTQHKNIKNYLVLTVPHTEIYKYLCACDYGLIF